MFRVEFNIVGSKRTTQWKSNISREKQSVTQFERCALLQQNGININISMIQKQSHKQILNTTEYNIERQKTNKKKDDGKVEERQDSV